jgi:hypothetical protein
MESMREQGTFTQHPLVPGRELDLRKCESMTEMEGSVHIRERERSHPFWELFPEFFRTQAFLILWRIDLKKFLILPKFLIRFF